MLLPRGIKPTLPAEATPNLHATASKPTSDITRMFLRRAASSGLEGYIDESGKVTWGREALKLTRERSRSNMIAEHRDAVSVGMHHARAVRKAVQEDLEAKCAETGHQNPFLQHRSPPPKPPPAPPPAKYVAQRPEPKIMAQAEERAAAVEAQRWAQPSVTTWRHAPTHRRATTNKAWHERLSRSYTAASAQRALGVPAHVKWWREGAQVTVEGVTMDGQVLAVTEVAAKLVRKPPQAWVGHLREPPETEIARRTPSPPADDGDDEEDAGAVDNPTEVAWFYRQPAIDAPETPWVETNEGGSAGHSSERAVLGDFAAPLRRPAPVLKPPAGSKRRQAPQLPCDGGTRREVPPLPSELWTGWSTTRENEELHRNLVRAFAKRTDRTSAQRAKLQRSASATANPQAHGRPMSWR